MGKNINIKPKDKLEKILMPKSGSLSAEELNEKKEEIFKIIPELRAEDKFDQRNPWHEYDVWMHTLKALESSKPNLDIRLTLLLHDIGKPHSYQEDGNIRHFRGHAEKSAEMSKDILKRLGYKNEKIEEILYLIENHSKTIDINNVNKDNLELTKKLFYVQFYDASAYNKDYIYKIYKKLTIIGRQIEVKQNKIKQEMEQER